MIQIRNNKAVIDSPKKVPKKVEMPAKIIERVLRQDCCWPMNQPEDKVFI